jgi:hypothetical protein
MGIIIHRHFLFTCYNIIDYNCKIQILFMLKFSGANSYLMGTCFCNGPADFTEINSNGTDVWNTRSITSTGILKQGVVATQNSVLKHFFLPKTYSNSGRTLTSEI